MAIEPAPGSVPVRPSRAVWIVGGVLGLVSLATAGTIAVRAALPPAAADAARTSVQAPVAPGVAKAKDRKVAAASTCSDCGVVESVRSFKRKGKGKGTGLGAIAGGVVGAAVGRQIGKGQGRSAMTVLGAVGGGVAGHEIEKRSRGVTVHEVRVRMDDGSLLTLEQDEPPDAGDRVIVQGNSLRPA